MNYSVNIESIHAQHLLLTPRKRTQKHTLLVVESGLILVRLGKKEYALEAGQTWWLPFDCLLSLSYLPNTHCIKVDFSLRIQAEFATQAGQVVPSALMKPAIQKITQIDRKHPLFLHLTEIIKVEATQLIPKLVESDLTKAINEPTRSSNLIDKELQITLQLREAYRLEQSGKKEAFVAQTFFDGNTEHYRQLKTLLLG